jgi:hypothetical protein
VSFVDASSDRGVVGITEGWAPRSTTEGPLLRVAATVLRAVIYSGGLFFGLLSSATAGYFRGGGGPMGVRLARVLVPLAMGLAAPSIWVLTARSESKDRWTLGYFLAWLLFICTGSVLVWIF